MNEIETLVNLLSRLPGIGKKNALRLSYFLINNKDYTKELVDGISLAISKISFCSICGNYTTVDPCNICTSEDRDRSILCIVEEPKDLIAIEETNSFNGLYHILNGVINPLEDKGPEKLRIKELCERIEKGNFNEVLIATNPTVEGEATFLYIKEILEKYNLKISRIAMGIPMGGSLEYADKFTLGKAIQSKFYLK
ncbi:MAG TPA: recombination mediator RecR [Spirochaetota bacterium]|nr:recombination mediator RecR [Spirochaetota bacterium]HOL55987.1 recombination mediator RecR [Spirochaetota bacterium]HPP03429.1 recombination mediator RecR [Spirochaetota bacterium]